MLLNAAGHSHIHIQITLLLFLLLNPQQHRVIDYDEVLRLAKECKPKLIVAGASAYARAIDFKRFREIADEVGAVLMVDMAHIAGLVAAGLHMSPIPYAHVTRLSVPPETIRNPLSINA